MTPIVATSNVESVMLGVAGSLAASLVYLLEFRWSTRSKIEVTATAGEDHIEVVIANNSRRAMFDVQMRATAVMFDGAMGTTYKNTRPLTLSEITIPVLLAARRAQNVMMAPGRRPVVDVSPASRSTVDVGPCGELEALWVTVSAVDSVSGVRCRGFPPVDPSDEASACTTIAWTH
jgi:hypothetical protein